MTPWTAEASGDRNTLIWFNFKDSLGGELFTARALKSLRMAQFGPRPVIAADQRLIDLLAAEFPNATVVSKGSNLAGFRGQIDHFFLARDAVRQAVLLPDGLARLAAQTFNLVGGSKPDDVKPCTYVISWKTTNRRQGRYRNIPLKPFAEALAATGHNYVSAQHGVTPKEERLLEDILGDRIALGAIDTASDVNTFASGLSKFDGIVSIDNSLVHVAGCFGLPAVVLLSVPSYWAWPSGGTDSRWYRSVQAIHQKTPKDWKPVLIELTAQLGADRRGLNLRTSHDGNIG